MNNIIYFNEEHHMFRNAIRKFVEKEITPYADEWEKDGKFPRELYKKMGDMGYLGVRFPEEYGGSGLDWFYIGILVEELCRGKSAGVVVDILLHMEAATHCISMYGTLEQKQKFLVPAIKGEKIAALGVTEPDFGSNVAGIRTSARRVDQYYIINGSKTFITNGTIADFITLAVRTGGDGSGGISLLLFPTDVPGFSARKLRKVGVQSSDTAELFFDDCKIPVENLLGNENSGFRYIMESFNGEKIVLALISLGVVNVIWEETMRYGLERYVFGKPVLKHQYWRQKMADVATRIEAARQLVYFALDKLNRDNRPTPACAMAKLYATETVKWVATECAQVFGGYGYMEEYAISRFYRDVMAFTIGAGTSEIMREIIADSVGLRIARHADQDRC